MRTFSTLERGWCLLFTTLKTSVEGKNGLLFAHGGSVCHSDKQFCMYLRLVHIFCKICTMVLMYVDLVVKGKMGVKISENGDEK